MTLRIKFKACELTKDGWHWPQADYRQGPRSLLEPLFSSPDYPTTTDEEFIYEGPVDFNYKLLYTHENLLFEMIISEDIMTRRCGTSFNHFIQGDQQNPDIFFIDRQLTAPIFMFLRSKEKMLAAPVIEELEVLLQNESISISAASVGETMDQVDDLLGKHEIDEIPGKLLQQLDQFGARLKLEAGTGRLVRTNFAMLVADPSAATPVRGMRVAAGYDYGFYGDMFEFVDDTTPRTFSNETSVIALLPPSLSSAGHRTSFMAFRTDRAFRHDRFSRLNSWVVSVSVENFTGFHNGEMIEIYLKPTKRAILRDQKSVCAYWHFDANGTGHWSPDGCELVVSGEDQLHLCHCDHLTHFALIIVSREVFSFLNERALELITVIGCSLSIFGTTMIGVTAAVFRSWRTNDSNKVWLHLCSAVLSLNICFLITLYVPFNQGDVTCTILGIALHYSVLVTYCWMLVIAILSYRKLVLIFTTDIRYKLLISSLFSWGFPLLVIGLLLAVAPRSYSRKYEDMTPNGNFCYPTGIAFWVTVFLPIGIMWFINWCLYAIIIKSMNESKKMQKHSSAKKATLRTASVSCLLAFICGIPWIFGFFARNIVAAYLFTFTVTFQGFVLFLFFVVGSNKTRRLWISTLRKVGRGHRVTSSGVTNRSQPTNSARLNLNDSSSVPLTRSKFYVKPSETNFISPPQKKNIQREELVAFKTKFLVIVEQLCHNSTVEFVTVPNS